MNQIKIQIRGTEVPRSVITTWHGICVPREGDKLRIKHHGVRTVKYIAWDGPYLVTVFVSDDLRERVR